MPGVLREHAGHLLPIPLYDVQYIFSTSAMLKKKKRWREEDILASCNRERSLHYLARLLVCIMRLRAFSPTTLHTYTNVSPDAVLLRP